MKLRNIGDNLMKKEAPEVEKAAEGIKDKFESAALSVGQAMGLRAPGSSGGNLEINPAEAVKKLEEDFASKSAVESGSGVAGGAGSPVAADENMDIGIGGDTKTEETQIAEVMAQDLDYGQNDINNSSNTNIFEVLSNRYQRSGMRRLFDEEGKLEADKPAEDDINK
jgi:hypothetical protein